MELKNQLLPVGVVTNAEHLEGETPVTGLEIRCDGGRLRKEAVERCLVSLKDTSGRPPGGRGPGGAQAHTLPWAECGWAHGRCAEPEGKPEGYGRGRCRGRALSLEFTWEPVREGSGFAGGRKASWLHAAQHPDPC